jgi:hypothetical protein
VSCMASLWGGDILVRGWSNGARSPPPEPRWRARVGGGRARSVAVLSGGDSEKLANFFAPLAGAGVERFVLSLREGSALALGAGSAGRAPDGPKLGTFPVPRAESAPHFAPPRALTKGSRAWGLARGAARPETARRLFPGLCILPPERGAKPAPRDEPARGRRQQPTRKCLGGSPNLRGEILTAAPPYQKAPGFGSWSTRGRLGGSSDLRGGVWEAVSTYEKAPGW